MKIDEMSKALQLSSELYDKLFPSTILRRYSFTHVWLEWFIIYITQQLTIFL